MSKFSLHIDAIQWTMTCDYDHDHDCFGQGLKFQHSRESGHGQWSWSLVMVMVTGQGQGHWSWSLVRVMVTGQGSLVMVSGHRSGSLVRVTGQGQKVPCPASKILKFKFEQLLMVISLDIPQVMPFCPPTTCRFHSLHQLRKATGEHGMKSHIFEKRPLFHQKSLWHLSFSYFCRLLLCEERHGN